ncbi:Membrane-associated phosphatidylinositol transfer protein 2 [Liparis tanakae]|uniref:Membrane-associated phosphatidylinositol transfer protein 2 n=1 Tax=Liparis tanakae TaxID=230148 RepID=A0A4Z2HR05_9TELE|nr:Membrane-associated phosphatidylinositol transfer protein 2 [Liparis tanakae]
MLIKEYRIPMPMSVEEYRIAQLYMIQDESGGEHGRKSHRASVALQSRWCYHMPVDCVPFNNLVQIHSHMYCKNTH